MRNIHVKEKLILEYLLPEKFTCCNGRSANPPNLNDYTLFNIRKIHFRIFLATWLVSQPIQPFCFNGRLTLSFDSSHLMVLAQFAQSAWVYDIHSFSNSS